MTILITQRTGSDCMLACIAMALGKCYDDLWKPEITQKLADAHGCGGELEKEVFAIAALSPDTDYFKIHTYVNADQSMIKRLLRGRRAILSVPSLNYDSNHAVYWDGKRLWDPNPEEKNQYRSIRPCLIEIAYIFDENP